jgi:hypothetical protein
MATKLKILIYFFENAILLCFIFQKSSKKNRHKHSGGFALERLSDVDVVKDGGEQAEEKSEAPKDKEEQDIEVDHNLPYTIETSDVMGRLVISGLYLQAVPQTGSQLLEIRRN